MLICFKFYCFWIKIVVYFYFDENVFVFVVGVVVDNFVYILFFFILLG